MLPKFNSIIILVMFSLDAHIACSGVINRGLCLILHDVSYSSGRLISSHETRCVFLAEYSRESGSCQEGLNTASRQVLGSKWNFFCEIYERRFRKECFPCVYLGLSIYENDKTVKNRNMCSCSCSSLEFSLKVVCVFDELRQPVNRWRFRVRGLLVFHRSI